MEEHLELESRRKIYRCIKRNPGLHLRELSRLLRISTSLLHYHLRFMEKHDVIVGVKERGYARYYIVGMVDRRDKRALAVLREKIPLRIVLELLSTPCKHSELTHKIGISPPTISFHLKKLVNRNLVERVGGNYRLSNRKKVIKLLIQYKPFSLIDGFTELWLSLGID